MNVSRFRGIIFSMNTLQKAKPEAGLSRLQKAILVQMLDFSDWVQEVTGHVVPMPWRIRAFYGRYPSSRFPFTKAGNSVSTGATRAAESKTLVRLARRGLILRRGDRYTDTVELTDTGKVVASSLRKSGGTSKYRDIPQERLPEQGEWARKVLAKMGVDPDNPTVARAIEKNPVDTVLIAAMLAPGKA